MELSVHGRDVRLDLTAGATVADVAAAGLDAGAVAPGHPPATPVSALGLVRGAALPAGGEAAARGASAVLASIGGLDAGRRVVVGPGRALIGRGASCDLRLADPAVSRRHAAADVGPDGRVTFADLGSRNGTVAVEPGAVRLGGTEVCAADPDPGDELPPAARPPSPAGTVAFNRPPRPSPPPPMPPIEVPAPPAAGSPPAALGVMAVAVPVAMAAVLVAVLGNPLFGLLALLSPVVAVATHAETRRRHRRGRRRDAARRAADLAELTGAVAAARRAEVARRRAAFPDPAETLRRATGPSTRLWERRRGDGDFLRLRLGTGDLPWDPPLATAGPLPDDAAAAVAGAAVLCRGPAVVDAASRPIGVTGPRFAALAVARWLLCQACVHHGPADLPVLVAAAPDVAPDWDWTKWLPHVDDPGGHRRLAACRSDADALASGALEAGTLPFTVVDGDELLAGRRAPLRALYASGAPGVVVAPSPDRLPSSCAAVVEVDARGTATVTVPAAGVRWRAVLADGLAPDTAMACARSLARFEDPELEAPGAGLPAEVALLALLGLPDPTPAAVLERWRRAGADPPPAAPLGAAAGVTFEVDLAADGPHALVAGTTGAGKSELLRTLVAGLAAGADPDSITFVLVDFKGGSAFDACARLPHVVGHVTDLDGDLAARALRCLEAELRHREAVLRAAGAADLAAYRRCPGTEPLPRLVVVIDEFATLKAEVPEFVDALVGLAQRGRSLGMHLVLATQRPAGAVSDPIRANANLRIALRVQSPAESADVVDAPDAALLPRGRPGRAVVRLGPGEVVTVQAALATARSSGPVPPVRVQPFEFGPAHTAAQRAAGEGPTDLDRLVEACAAAWASTGRPAPRRPWPEPLPAALDRDRLPRGAVALLDDPDAQAQHPLRWDLGAGHLAVYGAPGSGTTTALLSAALALADTHPPDDLHLYAVDHGRGELGVLASLPHTGAVLTAGEYERQVRLVRRLRAELDRRRAAPGAAGATVVLIDGIASFLAQFDGAAGLEVADAFERVFADGPAAGIHVAVTADRAAALPARLAATVAQRWVLRLADPLDAAALGAAAAGAAPGRFVDAASGLTGQVAVPAAGWAAAVAAAGSRWPPARRPPEPVGQLAASVRWAALGAEATTACRPWRLPIGVHGDDLTTAWLRLWDGDHVLVAGPARSGRTTALATIAHAAATAGVAVLGAADAMAGAVRGPALVVVDDAEALDDPTGALERLVTAPPPGVHVVAAGRADALRGRYGHWTRTLHRCATGVLLRPNVDLDGDLLGVTLPRRVDVDLIPGRGFLVTDGTPRLVHLARIGGD